MFREPLSVDKVILSVNENRHLKIHQIHNPLRYKPYLADIVYFSISHSSRMTASAWDKFLLLSYKNWIIQVRHPVQTVFEVLVPVIVCALLILIRGLVEVEVFTDDFKYTPMATNLIRQNLLDLDGVNRVLAYSPNNPMLGNLVKSVADEYNFTVVPSATAEALEIYAVGFEPFASIEFEDGLKVKNIQMWGKR